MMVDKLYSEIQNAKDDVAALNTTIEMSREQDIIDSLKMVDDSKMGLYMIDKELAARVYTAPSIAGA